jgi:hypothetical protein
MKTLKYILILFLALGTFHSCLVDEETRYDLNDDGINLAGFEVNRILVSGIADGTEYTFKMRVKVVGPTVTDLTSDITVTFAADAASTAVAGTHYRIDNPTITLTKANNYLNTLDVTMTTEGIVTPLAEAPVLILNVVSATGDAKVTNNGKQLEMTLNFACYSEFQGRYSVTHTSSSGSTFTQVEDIVKTGVEKYETGSVGTWGYAPFSTNGYAFDNNCNVLSVPGGQILANTYSNEVFGHKLGSADPETGVLTLYYTIWFAAGNREYTAVYTPVAK